MESESLFITWSEVRKRSEGRTVYLYGRSEDWVHKSLSHLPVVAGIIDRNVAYHGQEYLGTPIMKPSAVQKLENPYFVITSSQFQGISDLLMENGFLPGADFCCSPDFRSYVRVEQLEALNGEVFFSSSDYLDKSRARGSARGGGIYRLDLQTGLSTSLLRASIRQFAHLKDGGWVAVDFASNLLLLLSSGFEVEGSAAIPSANACGVAVSEEGDLVLVADSGEDCVYVFNRADLSLLKKFHPFGQREKSSKKHHINDLAIRGDDVYFSYFSASGEYKSAVFDGGVSRANYRNERNAAEKVLDGLYKPHSPDFVDGQLLVADSMIGSVKKGRDEIARFPGFIRGLDGIEGFLAVGQSSDMYLLERNPGLGTTVINSGLYVMQVGLEGVREARFYPTPGITNIHDVSIVSMLR